MIVNRIIGSGGAMSEKITAIYIMARQEELTPEDKGSYERPLKEQEEKCRELLTAKFGGDFEGPVRVYKSRRDLVKDVENDLIGRLVVERIDRIGGNSIEIEGLLYELQVRKVDVMAVQE
jgi:hypothetical protein